MDDLIRIDNISQVHETFGMEKPKHPLVTVLPIDDKMTNFDYGDFRYVFGFYQISLKVGFSGSMAYGRNSYDFEEGSLICLSPNQIIQIKNEQNIKEISGWTLLFHPDLIVKSNLGKEIHHYSFLNYENHEALHVSEEEKTSLTQLVEKIEREYQQNIDKHSQDLIIANIELILKYCGRYYDRQFYTRSNLNKDVLSNFEKLMQEYFQSNKPSKEGTLTVKHCAQELGMSPNYFGDLIKNETGKSAKEHIQDYTLEKAKTLIVGSNLTISEIAHSLGFEHSQSFNKLFKAKVGESPGNFRGSNISN